MAHHSLSDSDHPSGSVAVLIAAAGRGERLGGEQPKALEQIAGMSLLTHALARISMVADIGLIVVAAPPDLVQEVSELCDGYPNLPILVVPGSDSRQASVARALAVVPPEIDVVLVHDAARAFAPAELYQEVVDAVRTQCDAIVPTLPVADTIKQVDAKAAVEATLDRASLRAVQTPQGFKRELLLSAYRAAGDRERATDDAGLVERIGRRVECIPGRPEAFKVTTPFDVIIAEAIVRGVRRGR